MTPDQRRRRRTAGLLAVGAVALAALALWLWRTEPLSERLVLTDPTLETLDTIRVEGRWVETHLGGPVTAADSLGSVWVGSDDRAVEVRGSLTDSLRVEDHVLVVGRLLEEDGIRWIDAADLTTVHGETLEAQHRSGEPVTVQPED